MICQPAANLSAVPMFDAALEQVLAIELESYPRPWTRQHFLDEMLSSHAVTLVALVEQCTVAGYIFCRTVAGEAEVLNLAVAPAYRHSGVGTFLLDSVLSRLMADGIQVLDLEVRVSNTAAINLYRRFGFIQTGVRRNYYEHNEDALLMQLHITEQKEL
jgi:[ribosomal protein S18]-alanine N-acetyltransferase